MRPGLSVFATIDRRAEKGNGYTNVVPLGLFFGLFSFANANRIWCLLGLFSTEAWCDRAVGPSFTGVCPSSPNASPSSCLTFVSLLLCWCCCTAAAAVMLLLLHCCCCCCCTAAAAALLLLLLHCCCCCCYFVVLRILGQPPL